MLIESRSTMRCCDFNLKSESESDSDDDDYQIDLTLPRSESTPTNDEKFVLFVIMQ